MDLPLSSSTPPVAPPIRSQRYLKGFFVGLGGLIIGGVVYSQPLGREMGVHLLGLCGPRSIPWLLSAFEDSNGNVNKAAYDNIRKMGPAAAPGLLAELKSSWLTTRVYAATMLSLQEIMAGRESAICGELLKLLDDDKREARLAAINALASLASSGSAALPKLLTMLGDDDIETRIGAMHAIVAIDRDSPATLLIVLERLKDAEWLVRADACATLEKIGTCDPRAMAALMALLQDPVPEVRANAVDYLGEIGPIGKAAIPRLRVLAKEDPSEVVRMQAAQSIKSLENTTSP